MNKIIITSAAVLALFTAPVAALEIENKDGQDFYVYIGNQTPDSTQTFVIPAGKKVRGLCGAICDVSVEGDGQELAVVSGEKLEIKGGKLNRKN